MAAIAATVPTEDELKHALIVLRRDNPTLGVPKLHALLLNNHPEWTVSERRTRKVLQQENLILVSSDGAVQSAKQNNGGASAIIFPSSKLIEGLDVKRWTPKVEVKFFDQRKGKGLAAREQISEGEVLWKEDPFILAAEWDIYDLQQSSLACTFCSTPLKDLSLVTTCSVSTSQSPCPAKFCNRLCLSRSGLTHPLLCSSQNPASVPLLTYARRAEWMALHALCQSTARLLLSSQAGDAAWQKDWKIFRSFAQLGMEERVKGDWMRGSEPDRAAWKKAFQLYFQAFYEPTSAQEKKKLAKILKKPLPKEIADALFTYDGFLLNLGRMNLNLEAHGGLYILHSHINHSCSPNISIRHLDQRTALSRITVIAKRDITPGEELFVTYVNPGLPLGQRRYELMQWGFGPCECDRCKSEAADPNTQQRKDVRPDDIDDLERELKAGLGVI